MIGLVLAAILWVQQPAPAVQTPTRGVVTGQIKALNGSAANGVRVAAVPVAAGAANTQSEALGYTSNPPVSIAMSDSQGRFRLENVPPGRYFILAGLANEPTFYPAATNTNKNQPTVITVAAGQTIENLNFNLLWPIGSKVSGSLKLNSGIVKGQTAVLTGSKVEEFLEVPVRPDGTFEFARVPSGLYLLSTFPPPPGLTPIAVPVRNADVTGLEITSPPTRTVTGRIVVKNGGPIPRGILSLFNAQSYVGAAINPDGTFTAKVQAARHRVDIAGMPVGYSLLSVSNGTADVTQGFTVGTADVSGIVVTLNSPASLPRVQGKVTGLTGARLSAAKVELTGPIFGTLNAPLQPDGSFQIDAVVPGLYKVRLLQVTEFAPVNLVVTSQAVTEVRLNVPVR